jgi:hypothetical protein
VSLSGTLPLRLPWMALSDESPADPRDVVRGPSPRGGRPEQRGPAEALPSTDPGPSTVAFGVAELVLGDADYAYGVACHARRTVARPISFSSRDAASLIAPSASASSTRGTPAASS